MHRLEILKGCEEAVREVDIDIAFLTAGAKSAELLRKTEFR